MAVEGSETAEGWYDDPVVFGQLRYFDGHTWTEHVASADSGWLPKVRTSLAGPDEPNLVVERKTIYGNKMLYVSQPDGTKVGRINIDTGKVTMDQPGLRPRFDGAVATWLLADKQGPDRPAASGGTHKEEAGSRALPSPGPANSATDWNDLATNRPGQSARKKAIEIKKAAPVKTFFTRVMGTKTEERAWRIGADGEEAVGKQLQRLGAGWHVIHAVPVGHNGADIDHLVIGPPGVFTLNTKTRSEKKVWVAERAFMVNGAKTDYLRNSRFEAQRASKLLSAACGVHIAVHPVIVVIAAQLTIKAQPSDVSVVSRRGIVVWLSNRRSVLTPQTVERVYGQARIDTTWR